MLLAGDIGGTKTALAILSNEGGPYAPLMQTEVHSADYASLQAIAEEFISQSQLPVDCACFGVAGPVFEGQVTTTNLPWHIDEASIAKELKLKSVHLMNDLEAIACAVPKLRDADIRTINAGKPATTSTIGVIAPGTGLGESFLTWNGQRYETHGSEGGHSDFAPTSPLQVRLMEFMLKRFDHVSYEHVCSGVGVPNVYDFLGEVENVPESPEVAAQIASTHDRSMPIIRNAMDPHSPSKRCAATIDIVVSILGSEAGNLALKVLATGGIYLAGGIATHILPALEGPRFLQSFRFKGRFSEMMSRIPVHVIVSRAALIGAAIYGLDHLKNGAQRVLVPDTTPALTEAIR
jgi:glucokinase